MIKQIERNLFHASYRKMPVNVNTVNVYLSENGDRVQAVVLFNQEEKSLYIDEYQYILKQIEEALEKNGYNERHIHSIICTNNVSGIQEIIQQMPNCWVIDLNEKELYIYENQPLDFYGIKKLIEASLLGESQKENSVERKSKAPTKINYKELGNIWRQYSVVTWSLVAINLILFLIMEFRGSTEDVDYMIQWGAMYVPYVLEDGQYYRLFTHMFLHFGMEHLFNNMLILFLLGGYVERHIGKLRYVITYLGTGILAGVVSMGYNILTDNVPVSAGASGAIFGIIGALLFIVLMHKGKLEDLSIGRMMIFVFLSLYSGIAQIDVDNAAHIGGFLSGIIIAAIIYPYKKRKKERIS